MAQTQDETYDEKRQALQFRKERQDRIEAQLDEIDPDLFKDPKQDVKLSDVVQVGSKVLIGGGLGVLAGVAGIALAASAAEVVVAGVVTKIAGIVGGALGLSFGVKKFATKKS